MTRSLMTSIWTVGHSNVPAAQLIETLTKASIELLVDIRRYPMSRRNPQFNSDALAASLREAGIDYRHAPELGGRRTPHPDSFNLGLRDTGFRGFADYMWTPEFDAALADCSTKQRHIGPRSCAPRRFPGTATAR